MLPLPACSLKCLSPPCPPQLLFLLVLASCHRGLTLNFCPSSSSSQLHFISSLEIVGIFARGESKHFGLLSLEWAIGIWACEPDNVSCSVS